MGQQVKDWAELEKPIDSTSREGALLRWSTAFPQ